MGITGIKTKLEYLDYAQIPSVGKRYELLEGDLQVTPASSPLHRGVSKRLQRMLEDYFEETGRGEGLNLETAVGSRKSAHPLHAPRKFQQSLITRKVTASCRNSLGT